ncbi:F-box protein SKIP1 [Rhynchospora pubera]|uniref:F-box protein SKIP1 n=1 Tax=Rhynchospora pubera TaxID=906938 RepID=A0AAV8HEF8_9POAL|nr:F-box protein SKIP1 [Rhynchospora pubera]
MDGHPEDAVPIISAAEDLIPSSECHRSFLSLSSPIHPKNETQKSRTPRQSMEEEQSDGNKPHEAPTELRDWSDLTTVCLINIFQRLSLADRWLIAMRVCRSWSDAARDCCLYAALDLEPAFDASGAGRPDTAAWWTPAFQRRVDSMMRSVAEWSDGALKEVRVRHCSDEALCFLAERSPELLILSVRSSRGVTDRSMSKVAMSCTNLVELDISNCYEVSYRSIEIIGLNCPNLTTLKRNLLNWLDPSQHRGVIPEDYLNALPQDGDTEALSISRFMVKLKHLELRFSKFSGHGLMAIAEACKDLESLDLFGCANLTSRGIEQARAKLTKLIPDGLVKPNFYIPRSVFHTDRYGHWNLYDERFQTSVFQI